MVRLQVPRSKMGLGLHLLIVNRTLRRVLALLRWVLAPEQLPPWPGGDDVGGVRTTCLVNRLSCEARLVGDWSSKGNDGPLRRFPPWLLSTDELPTLPGASRGTIRRRPRFLRWLLSGTDLVDRQLPQERETRPRRFHSWLWSREELPVSPGPPCCATERPPRFVRWLASVEHLPESRARGSGPVRRHRPLQRLCSPEVCPQIRTPSIERRPGFLRWIFSHENL